jgi:gluconolactonase
MSNHGPHIAFATNARYPDPAVQVLHERFAALRIYSASVEQLASGCRWSEGPVWFGDHRCLLWSDIPNNRILRWDDASGQVTTFRSPSQHANGLARDLQGRLLT